MGSVNRILLITMLCAAMVLVGCSSGATTSDTPAGTGTATEGEAPPEEAAPAAGGSTDGAALVEQKCTMCHTLDRVNSAVYDEAQWSATVDRMVASGLVVTSEERQAIIDYLAERDAAR